MTGPSAAPPLICRVCGTDNPATRQFCRKCASDLRAPITPPGATPATTPVPASAPVPLMPIVLGGGLALLVVVILGGLFVLMNAGPGASPSASAVATATAAPPSPTEAPALPTEAPPATDAPTSEPEPTAATPGASTRPPRIRSFVAPEAVPCGAPNHSGFILVSWEIRNATGVTISIDGPGIYDEYEGLTGRRVELPFTCSQSHTYLLTTVGGIGPPATREVVVEPLFETTPAP